MCHFSAAKQLKGAQGSPFGDPFLFTFRRKRSQSPAGDRARRKLAGAPVSSAEGSVRPWRAGRVLSPLRGDEEKRGRILEVWGTSPSDSFGIWGLGPNQGRGLCPFPGTPPPKLSIDHIDQNWSKGLPGRPFDQFDQTWVWSKLINFDQFWSNLANFDQSWSKDLCLWTVRSILIILVKYGHLAKLWSGTTIGQIWPKFGPNSAPRKVL